ncbi:DUF1963 domain-containing protein [Micromonospora sp. LOL_023]|uniref:DUF1963 domain-containing protein n=1 Tax=Micromonospora sp. LOL_023 TaxID=3345418 RepID=UPI003A872A50
MDHLAQLRRNAQELDIPPQVADWLLGFARPRIVLHRDGQPRHGAGPAATTGPIAGYLGGDPMLPADVEWSGFPHFIAAVDGAALPSGVLDIPFPADGTLLFFANAGELAWGTDAHGRDVSDTYGRIVYVPPGTPTAARTPGPDHPPFRAERVPLRYEIAWTMPGHNSPEYLQLTGKARDLFDKYRGCEIGHPSPASAGVLAIGGHSTVVQEHPLDGLYPPGCELDFDDDVEAAAARCPDDLPLPPRPGPQVAPDAEWVALAELKDHLNWGKTPTITFWTVRRDHLAARHFDQVLYQLDLND